jgi:diguanylate cyclase (GGDEF)-like protein/PAS domain S-box-containing protein
MKRVRLLAIVGVLAVLLALAVAARQWLGGAGPQSGRQVISVGLYENAPKVYTAEDGRPAGLFVELLDEMARDEGWLLHYVPCKWADCLAQLELGHLDLMPDVAFSVERARRYDFHTVSVASSWSQVFSNPRLKVTSLAELAGKRVAILEGGIQQSFFAQLMAAGGYGYQPVPVASLDDGYAAVLAGEADAVVTNSFFAARNGGKYKLQETPIVFLPTNLYFATANGRNAHLLERIDAHLTDWRRDSRSVYFDTLRRTMAAPPEVLVPRWVQWSLAGLGATMLLLVAISMLLRWQVDQRTRALVQTTRELEREHASLERLVTEIKFTNTALQTQQETSLDAILQVDESGKIVSYNQQFVDLWGLSPQLVKARVDAPVLQSVVDQVENPQEFVARVQYLYEHRDEKSRDEIRLADGRIIDRYSAPVVGADGQYYGRVWYFRDVTERKRYESRIEYLATHDALTDLPNRNLIRDRITQAIAHARRSERQIAVMYVDFDRFKVINDGFGHPFGDAALREAGKRLASVVRDGDTVARQSGDEFLLLLSDLRKPTDVHIVAQKVLEAFERPVVIDGREFHLSASVGVSVFPEDGQDAEILIDNADVAMYRAKRLGGNAYQSFARGMSEDTKRRVELETELRSAIGRNELHLEYQPKVDLATGHIVGCEALVRWTHRALGRISPGEFIPIAEDSGLIVPVGDWVLRSACAQNKSWHDAGLPPVVVSVNLSARQFLQQDVVAWTLKALRDTGLAPERLELELTESLIAQDVEKVIATVDRLKEAGVRLSIDDFGTGYSSLSYLKRFRVDALKIDQSFIRNLVSAVEDATIAVAVIALAHNLRMTAVAEGVETEAQRRFLHLNRCNTIQGYLFSRPVPAAEFEAMLRDGKRLA